MADHLEHEQHPEGINIPKEGHVPEGTPTDIWECVDDDCNGWMRKNLSFDSSPDCPLCDSKMKSGVRLIPKLKKEFKRKGIYFAKRNKH